MRGLGLIVGLILFLGSGFALTFCESHSQTSQDSDSTDLEQEAEPDIPTKGTAQRTEPQIDIGANHNKPSKLDSTSIARPPRLLRGVHPSIPSDKKLPEVNRNFAVAIDIGHSKAQGGAVSARGISEYQFNRRLGEELFDLLRSSGFSRSFIINPSGAEIRLLGRSEEANEKKADLFLAIHHDSVKDRFLKDWTVDGKAEKYCDEFHGYSVFFSRKNLAAAKSRTFALELGDALVTAGFTPTLHHVEQEHRPIVDPAKGVYAFDDLIVLKGAKMPAVLLECGVIVNRLEELQLNTAENQERLTNAIETAIQRFAGSAPSSGENN